MEWNAIRTKTPRIPTYFTSKVTRGENSMAEVYGRTITRNVTGRKRSGKLVYANDVKGGDYGT